MKAVHTLLLLLSTLLVVTPVAADPDTLDYLYAPGLDPAQDELLRRLHLHARNEEYETAQDYSLQLLDASEELISTSPQTYGQILINHGIVHSAAGNYQLAISVMDRGLELMETRHKPFDVELINGLMARAITQLRINQLDEAEDTFRRAQHITHRKDGVYSADQLIMVNYLTATNLKAGDARGADQQQLFSLRVAEQVYGPESLELLPTLNRLGSYFATRGSTIPMMVTSELRMERDILFKTSLRMYARAINIIEHNYGDNDLRLVEPLRGTASARMLQITGRRQAEEALLRSRHIVDNNPNSDLTDRVQALVDLGDLYIILSDTRAGGTYLAAWDLLQESPEAQTLAEALFGTPVRLFPRRSGTIYLDRTPDAAQEGSPLFVELEYSVSPQGRVDRVRVVEKNVPNEQVRQLRQRVRATRFRPRISAGEIVTAEGLKFRQLYEVVYRQVVEEEAAPPSAEDA